MFSTKKYLPIFAAFVVGVIGAAGYVVHAASIASNLSTSSQVQTTAQDTNSLDGETADGVGVTVQTSTQDPQQLDGEQADDSKVAATSSQPQEAESGPDYTGPDTGEVSN
ncbi:MAG: hypothetical protein P4L81_05390 [Candidatus Pacebacteria bacterium]|nr:hypothetical protein [Candidatus Paceibacterota bacterium]